MVEASCWEGERMTKREECQRCLEDFRRLLHGRGVEPDSWLDRPDLIDTLALSIVGQLLAFVKDEIVARMDPVGPDRVALLRRFYKKWKRGGPIRLEEAPWEWDDFWHPSHDKLRRYI